MAGEDLPAFNNDQPKAKPVAKMFACTSCGASVTVKYPGASLSVVCQSCNSVIDVSDENYKVLSLYLAKTTHYRPIIPLGQRGKLNGKIFEVIGYLVRADQASNYSWQEYLLFNPYYGYRWLVEDRGNWNLVRTIKEKPASINRNISFSRGSYVTFEGEKYLLYNSGRARVEYVLGEFYWRVVMGSTVFSNDFVCPPKMLSMEKDEGEVVWSLAEYIEPEEIRNAFKLQPEAMPPSFGLSATSPPVAQRQWASMSRLWALFFGILTAAQIWFFATASQEEAMSYRGVFTPNAKQNDTTTPVFTLRKDKANAVIYIEAPVSNSWFYVSGELVDNKTGASYPFERSVEYYFGSDSDGYWSEGGARSDVAISAVPGGQYYLNVDTESGGFTDNHVQQYTISVGRDVRMVDNYCWFVFLLSILPVISWCLYRQEEVDRWSNSDYSPYVSPE
jgi:hypothetical protein